jgi:hypothetical protein
VFVGVGVFLLFVCVLGLCMDCVCEWEMGAILGVCVWCDGCVLV